MSIALALIAILIVAIYFWQKNVFNYWTKRGIPQIQPKFPLGTMSLDKHYSVYLQEVYTEYKDKSKYVGMYNSMLPMLLILDNDLIKSILIKDFNSFHSHGFYYNEKDDPLSAHLFALDGPRWKELRAKINQIFTLGKIKMMTPIMADIGQRFKEIMDEKIRKGPVDMPDMFERYTIDVIGSCALGLECNSLKDPNVPFKRLGHKFFNHILFSPIVLFMVGAFPNLARKLRVKLLPRDVSKFFLDTVIQTIEHRAKNNIKRNDFMDLLIAMKNENKSNSLEDSYKDGLSVHEIAAQCLVFFLAGFETSATTSSFTVFELAKNQDIQDKLRTHIREVMQRHEGQLTYEALQEMTYLDQCIKEALRMYPAASMIFRRVTAEYKLPDTNTVLPVGTDIAISSYAFQRDPETYPNPDEYNPDNFTPEAEAGREYSAWLPFGGGPRVCIGERFGMMQTKVGLAHLIGSYRFTLNPRTSPDVVFNSRNMSLTSKEKMFYDVELVQ